jgi:CDP-glycerol glycerophosphotransferase (TagB/SpsB family)
MDTFVERCLRQLEHRLDCVTLVKPHPSDDIAAIAGLLRRSRYKDTVRLCTQVVEGLLAADVVISQISTVICEAAFWRRPVVLVDFEGVVGWDVYKQAGMCVQVTKESELTPAIDAVLSGQLPDSEMRRAQQEFSARYFLTPDGFAARRVVQVLATLVDDATARRVTG